jgi:hypothetical protein
MSNLSIQDRGRLYNASPLGQQFPDSQFAISDRWISATWIMGNNYKSLSARGENDQPFYGAYPPGYLRRIWPMFPDAKEVIHLFSGSLTKEAAEPPATMNSAARVLRVDSRADRDPDVIVDAERFADILGEKTDVIFADPPYSAQDAENYGVPLCNKKKVLEQCHLALRPGGLLAWMDQSIPMYAKKNWRWVGVISMYRSTNHRVRGVMLFERV